MDFFAMKRKQLQALCKEHGIRANLKNTEMAERLTLLFNEDEKSMTDVELVEKQLDATEMVTGFVESPKVKKVKFSPNNETFYFVATDKDSDSDCDYSPKKKSRGEKALGKKEVIAGEVEVVEIKDIPVRVLRSRKQKVVSGAVESIVSPRQVMSGVENVDGKGIKPVKFQKESNAIVLRKGKVIVRDDARKRTRNENSEGASQVVPSVEAAVENEVILPKPPLRRSKRKTTLFSPVAGAEKELGISEAVETVKLGREPVTRKDAAKPGRRSNRIACKKLSAETSDDMIATAVEMDGLIKENQEPSLLEGSSLVVYESLDRSTVLQIGKEVERDVARKRPRNKDFGGNSKVEPSLENEVLPPKSHSRRSNSRTASLTELSMPLEESKIDVGSEVQPVGNGNKTGCCFNKEAVEKSRKKRKGSRKKIDSTTKDHPDSFAISTVYSDFEKRTDILAHLNENQLVESVNFQGTSMFHKEHNAIQPVINHMESAALEDAFFSKSSIYSNSAVGVMEDTDQENTVEQNPLASPDKLSNVVVSSKFACVRHVRSMTYGPVCEGQTSNFLDLNGESETEELVVKSISRIGGVLDNQLANGVKGNVSEDQKSIGTTVMVQVKMESRKPAEAAAETIGEMHLDITVPSDTTLSPLDASAVKKADGDAQNSSTSGVSCTNGEYEQGMLEEVSREKVDEGLDTGIYGSEEETHTLHSKDTEEVHDLHNIGTSANCSADSTESSMLKPEMGVDFSTDSPVTASDLENKVLELEAASPILNNSVMNGVFRDDQTSGLNKSGPEMSKGNSKSEYIEDVKCDDTFEENPIASPCTLSSMMVSSNIACVHDVRSFTYQPECEGQTSNLVDLNEGSKTEDSVIVKSISRRCAVLDDQLASGVTAGVSEDQKLIDQIVMVQVDMESKKPTEAAAEAVGEIHLGTVPSDTILTRLDSSPVDQVGNEFQVDCALAGGINMNIGTKFSPTCVSEVPDETTFSWDKQTLGNRDSTKEVMRADNESVKALDRSQMIPIVTQEVVYHTGRNSEFDDSVMLDSHNIDGQVAKVKFPEISGVTEDSEEKYENESAYDGATKEVVSADNEPFEELDIDRTLPPVLEEVIECIEKSSNLDESVSPDLQNADGQVAEDEFLNENFGNANRESEEKSDAFDIVQMLQPAVEVEKGSNSDDSVLPDLPNTDGQVAENKFLNEIFVNAPEEIEEKYEPKSSNSDRSPITIAKRIMDELERGTMPVVLKSNGDAQHSSSCGVSYSNDEYEQGDLNCSEGDKNNLKEKEIVVEDLGKDPERMNLHMPVGDNARTDGFGMLESLSGENVDEGPDTGVCGCEEENHILISEETEEILDLHNIGSLVTCSADSTKPSMLKPEVGDDCPTDSPVTTNHVKCSLHEENESLELEAVSPISNSFGMKGLLRDDQTSGFKKSGLEMSKSNSKSEYIEDLKNTKERIDNSQDVIEELYHQEHKVMGQVVEPKFTQEMSNQCHIGSALMDTNVCIPSIWDDSEVKPCTDNTCAKPQKCSGGAIASVFNVFPSLGDLCGLKAFSKADSENAKEKVLTNACSVGQPAENLRVSEDLEAHTTIGNVMLIKQEADANSLLSFGNVGPNIVSPEVVESSKNNMAAQFAGFEVSNLRSNEASSSKGSTLDDQIKCNLGNDVLVYGNKDNNVADKVNTGSIEAITGIKNVSDGVKSVEITAQRLDGDGLSGERNSAYVKSFFDISRSRTESDSPLSLQNVSLSCGVFEKRHLSVQGGYDSIGLKPGRVSSLKFEDAGKDGIIDTSVSGLRHDQTEIIAMENIGSPLVNSLGMNWIFGDEVHNSDPEMSNATSSSEDVKIGNGGVASPQVGAGEEVVKLKSTQELAELDSIKGRALEADLKISIGVSTTPIRKKKTQRDIFIPKTPKNLIDRSDMKENFNARKSEQVTNITSGKPLNNRRALEDLQNK
uniref:uncharacterized protein LOC101309798 isoform X6 n=1 Tax=Fragaria vesca subsp. vesca TaxID=101020 RepID=UPI0005CB3D78|nr:PREDICTED: uncharacterized protein LOC101309798 isoform X6 [Fragaria vesca subsp. vesca]